MSIRVRAHLIAALVFAAAFVLFRFAPQDYAFYPKCPTWILFHLYCPGCGATRAAAALLHGNLKDAIHYNALVTFLLPFLAAYFAVAYVSVIRNGKPRWIKIPVSVAVFLVAVTLIFALVRNIPGLMFPI